MGTLSNRVCLVTGAARGIGEAVVRRFAAEGASVVVADIRDELGERLARDLGPAAAYQHLNVASEDAWAAAVEFTESRFGKLDGLVNNAGVFEFQPLASYSLSAYQRLIDINQTGVFLGMRSVLPSFERAGGGTIVNVSSVAGLVGAPYSIAYTASKFAVTGMTRAGALELGPLGIRVNSVHPGMVATPLNLGDGVEPGAMPGGRPDGRRMADAREIANMIHYLTSDESSFSNGGQFVVDDGGLAGPRLPARQSVAQK